LFDTGFRLPMPTLGLGGGGSRGRGNIVRASLRRVATQVEGGSVADCGHFIPEERPEELARELRRFLATPGPASVKDTKAPRARRPRGKAAG
jgi:pimeloyl-ACP methyl ester carboxylesterase